MRKILVLIGTIVLATGIAFAQAKETKPQAESPAKVAGKSVPPAPAVHTTPVYEPSEIETLRLQVKQKDALLAQVQVGQAQAQFQKASADFFAEVEAVKKAHAWPETVQVDPATLKFSEPPKPPVPADKK